MTGRRIDHTAIVVADLDEAIERHSRLLEPDAVERASVPSQDILVAFLCFGDTKLELIQSTRPDSGVARFLDRRGEALHHVAMEVDDIRAELESLAGRGVELIDREPRSGVDGLVAFVHPRGTGGVLLELVQRTSPSDAKTGG
jgi:methylmalonyl-CoA/ethylmalonyl-CoA epimerase